ncbi:MAG: 3-keto-5-aminohexanoate cleavage protein [Blastococcus sp.]
MPLLKACLNGARRPAEHPDLPVTPEHVARDAVAVREAGADAVHLHVKDADGADTLRAAEVTAVLSAVRTAAPGLPVGVTTGAWAEPDPYARVALIQAWTVLPDFASVNWHEAGAERVAAALLDRGVGVEAGLWHAEAVRAWLASSVRDRCLRVLVELPDDARAAEDADELLAALSTDDLGRTSGGIPVLLHGEDRSAWPVLRIAARRGLATRIGLEDALPLPDDSRAPGNASLVAAARRVIAEERERDDAP